MAIETYRIDFQDDVDSYPIDENFQALTNAVNDIQNQVDELVTEEAPSEVVNARDNADTLRDRLRGASKAHKSVLISGGTVEEESTPDMSVKVNAGSAIVDGVYCEWDETHPDAVSVPVSNSRYDAIVVNSDNSISIVEGIADAFPAFPTILSSQHVIAFYLVTSSDTIIEDADIINCGLCPKNTPIIVYGDTDAGAMIDTLANALSFRNIANNDIGIITNGYEVSKVKDVLKRQVFTSDDTWVKPDGISMVKVTMIGGGGGGGGAATGHIGGGGGAAGQFYDGYVSVSDDVEIIIGDAGAAGIANSNGGDGGNTSFGLVVALGGNGGGYGAGGNGGDAIAPIDSSTGGAGSGDYGVDGVNGGNGIGGNGGEGGTFWDGSPAPLITYPGGGGGGGFGGNGGDGGDGDTLVFNGGHASGYGSGGGGGAAHGDSGALLAGGGMGSAGICIVEWTE